MKKYELTTNCKTHLGRTLFQIKALTSFGDVIAGELGGYIETENNLSQTDNAWVAGNAKVYGNAEVAGKAEWLGVGPIGSRGAFTTFFKCKDKEIRVGCGCFCGTIAEFRARVAQTHNNNKHAKMYNLAADMAELQINGQEG